jgi:16S rRNA (adenine1518-N6/adenine1519-N6)-dimethyltransferase
MTRRKRLGQHYLVDRSVIEEVIRLVPRGTGQKVLEIGTGRGALTSELCRVASKLEAFEIDRDNYERTKRLTKEFPWVDLKLVDAFEQDPEFDIVVSSLPYSESSRFVEWLSTKRYEKAIVILQEDFVRKIMAKPGRKNYRAISVISQCSSRIEIVRRVLRSSFDPPPMVSSVLIVIQPRLKLSSDTIATIKKLFSVRRRRIGGALKTLGIECELKSPKKEQRVYQMDPDDLLEIART